MIGEHDKEMDALLRRLAKSERSTDIPAGGHIDADEISVFAENALPAKARERVTAHLADCGRCRTILSNVVALSVQEAPASEERAGAAVSLEIPWYRKLFAVRNLATALGALLVLFAGFFAVFLIRNMGGQADSVVRLDDANVATAAESERPADAPAAEEQAAGDRASEPEAAENSSTPAAPGRSAEAPRADVAGEKRQIPVRVAGTPSNEAGELRTASGAGSSNRSALKVNSNAPRIAAPAGAAPATVPPPAPPPPPVVAQESAPARPDIREAGRLRDKDDAQAVAKAAGASEVKKERAATRRVGGKSFTLRNRVWYDSEYSGQATTNVRRGTPAFRQLESGLRSIANDLGGTVVVVWKSKAYRID